MAKEGEREERRVAEDALIPRKSMEDVMVVPGRFFSWRWKKTTTKKMVHRHVDFHS